jgi:hypothetical protein
MWQRIDIYKHVCLRPSINADLLQLREKEEQSFTTTNIVESDIDFVAHLPALPSPLHLTFFPSSPCSLTLILRIPLQIQIHR